MNIDELVQTINEVYIKFDYGRIGKTEAHKLMGDACNDLLRIIGSREGSHQATQKTFFNAEAGELARDEAIENVANSNAEWIEQALCVIREIACKRNTCFSTDMVWLRLDDKGIDPPGEARAMGAAMRMAAGRKWIRPTDMTIKSSRASCHRRPVRLWETILNDE